MRWPRSLALRLTMLFSATATVIFATFGWLINQSTEQHFEAGDIAELTVIEKTVEKVLSENRFKENLAAKERRFADILVGHHRASMTILDSKHRIVYASPELDFTAVPKQMLREPSGQVGTWTNAGHTYRVLVAKHSANPTTTAGNNAYTLLIAVQTDYHLQFLAHFHQTLWAMVVSSIFVLSAMGWIAVRQGLAPLHDIVARIRRISADELNIRLTPEALPVELKSLGASFNDMLERVDRAFRRLSDFNADIAHELRTPVTSLITQTQVALSKARTVDEYREILYSNMEEYERMAQLVEDMLFLARTDSNASGVNRAEVDLTREVHTLFDYYEGWAEEQGIRLTQEGAATAYADRLMLQRALGNLLSNAIRHTPEGETVRVILGTAGDGQTSIVVENPGVEIPPEHLHRLFDRFYRVDPSRQSDGHSTGLGLAIAKSIVEAHDGTIHVISSAGRTRFEIRLPPVPTPAV